MDLVGTITLKNGSRAIITASDNRLYVAGGIHDLPGSQVKVPKNAWACRSMMFAISVLYSDDPDAEIRELEKNGKWNW